MKEVLNYKGGKIEVSMLRSGKNSFSTRWRPINSTGKFTYITSGRVRDWTGARKASKEFHEMVEVSKHPGMQFSVLENQNRGKENFSSLMHNLK